VNYYQHHIGDFNNATRHLTRLERSIYRDLIELYYDREAPIPCDVEQNGNDRSTTVQRACRLILAHTDDEQAAVMSVLSEFFELHSDGWHQTRCDLEIERFYTKSEQARNAGIASAERRANRKAAPVQRPLNEKPMPVESSLNGSATTHDPLPNTHNPIPITQYPSKSKTLPTAKPPSPKTNPVWESYSAAYAHRHGATPPRNKKINGMLASLLERIPADSAPDVAAFYLTSNRGLYVSAKHPVDLLLRDAEALHTEWVTGKQGTETQARQADKTQANGDVWKRLIDENEVANAH
jgi:uncharacterized protein YdaU (DUF1376 family)